MQDGVDVDAVVLSGIRCDNIIEPPVNVARKNKKQQQKKRGGSFLIASFSGCSEPRSLQVLGKGMGTMHIT